MYSQIIGAAPPELVTKALASALALVAPAGFTQADRELWLKAATITLEGIPTDLLKRGVQKARLTVDHPSKIIPAIMAEVEYMWGVMRRSAYAKMAPKLELVSPPVEPEPAIEPIPDEEVRALSKPFLDMGLSRGWLEQDQVDRVFGEHDEDD